MTVASMVERIRTAIAAQLERFGVTDVALHETILIRNGLYCGRKFQCAGYHVVWFVEENEVKFFNPTGTLLLATSAVTLLESAESVNRRAA